MALSPIQTFELDTAISNILKIVLVSEELSSTSNYNEKVKCFEWYWSSWSLSETWVAELNVYFTEWPDDSLAPVLDIEHILYIYPINSLDQIQ